MNTNYTINMDTNVFINTWYLFKEKYVMTVKCYYVNIYIVTKHDISQYIIRNLNILTVALNNDSLILIFNSVIPYIWFLSLSDIKCNTTIKL